MSDNMLMGNKTEIKNRILWIDNLKLIAAYGVLLGHCYSLFIGQNDYGKEQLSSFTLSLLNLFSFFYNGDMWVIVFCMLSGYFAASKHFGIFRELIMGCIRRYMRFVEPLALLAVIILLTQLVIGFELRTNYVANKWVGLPMDVTLLKVLKMILFFNPELNNPLWMLRALFIGGILMYFINFFLVDYLNFRHKAIAYSAVALPCFVAGKWNAEMLVLSCVLMGGSLRYCWYPKKQINDFVVLSIIVMIIFMLSGGQNLFAHLIPDNILPIHWNLDRKWFAFWWIIILWLLFSKSNEAESLLGKKKLSNNSEHSFYVYILHFIILQTAVTWIFAMLMSELGFCFSALIATVCCLIITVVLAKCFGECYRYLDEIITRRMRG